MSRFDHVAGSERAVARSGVFAGRGPILVYLAGTFAVSWLLALTFHLAGGEMGTPASQAMIMLYTLPPGLLALVMHAVRERESENALAALESLGLRLRVGPWWLFAWLLPLIAYGLTNVLALALPGTSPALTADDFIAHFGVGGKSGEEFAADVHRFVASTGLHPLYRMVLPALMAGVTVNALRGLGEEIGWRGYVHRELRTSFFREVSLVGPLWGLFYLPLIAQGLWYGGASAGLPMGIAWCTAASALLLFIRRKSGGVFAPAILYGTLEGMSRLPPLTKGLDEVWVGLHGLSGILSLLIIFGGLRALDRAVRAADGP